MRLVVTDSAPGALRPRDKLAHFTLLPLRFAGISFQISVVTSRIGTRTATEATGQRQPNGNSNPFYWKLRSSLFHYSMSL